MSEYNIQMNKYNALNAEYDQLYPQPMKHANTHAKDGSDPITPASIGAYTKGETDTLLSSKPNPNLLDNWYFPNPVDQRQGRVVKPNTTYYSDNQLTTSAGTTSAYVTAYRYATGTASGVSYASFKLENSDTAPTYYAAPENVVRGYTGGFLYTIDRWKLEDSTGKGVVLINDDGSITIKNPEGNTDNVWWTQYRETDFSGEQCTISVLATEASGGAVYTGANNLGAILQQGMTTLTGVPTGNVAARIVVSPGNAVTVRGIKLELGTTQTLAHQENGVWVLNEIPDYGEQLARCQMRQIVLDATPGFAVGRCVKASDTFGHLMIPVPCSFGNGNVAVVTTGDFRNVGYNVYADIPSSALSTTGRVVGGMCVIDINANVVGDGMLDSGSSGRIVLDRNL